MVKLYSLIKFFPEIIKDLINNQTESEKVKKYYL